MGEMRIRLCSLATSLVLAAQAPPLCAQTPPDLMPVLATCAGRLSALMEFQWLVQDPQAQNTEILRVRIIDVLNAVTKPTMQVTAMSLRIEAKVAEADLLRLGQSGANPRTAHWAHAQAAALVATCSSLVVS